MRVTRSIAVILRSDGSRREPGGWKWTLLGAGSRCDLGTLRHTDGGAPKARVNARVKPSWVSNPASCARSTTRTDSPAVASR